MLPRLVSKSRAQVIHLPQPPKVLRLQAWTCLFLPCCWIFLNVCEFLIISSFFCLKIPVCFNEDLVLIYKLSFCGVWVWIECASRWGTSVTCFMHGGCPIFPNVSAIRSIVLTLAQALTPSALPEEVLPQPLTSQVRIRERSQTPCCPTCVFLAINTYIYPMAAFALYFSS